MLMLHIEIRQTSHTIFVLSSTTLLEISLSWAMVMQRRSSHFFQHWQARSNEERVNVWGMLGAYAVGQLPRNEKKVQNQRRKRKINFGELTSECALGDELFAVMQRAHTQDLAHKLVCDIKASPEPAVVLAEDHQLQDLVCFGTKSSDFSIITIDPTFSLGSFDFTPITYRNLLLKTRRSIFLGPVLVHYKKTFSTYLFFASSLIGQCPQLQGIRAFGTDSKQPLINAFKHKFTFSHHITCFIHVCWNIKEKLNDCSVPTNVGQVVLDDIFGQHVGTVFEEDLVDSFDIMIFRVNSNLYWRNGAIWRHLVQ